MTTEGRIFDVTELLWIDPDEDLAAGGLVSLPDDCSTQLRELLEAAAAPGYAHEMTGETFVRRTFREASTGWRRPPPGPTADRRHRSGRVTFVDRGQHRSGRRPGAQPCVEDRPQPVRGGQSLFRYPVPDQDSGHRTDCPGGVRGIATGIATGIDGADRLPERIAGSHGQWFGDRRPVRRRPEVSRVPVDDYSGRAIPFGRCHGPDELGGVRRVRFGKVRIGIERREWQWRRIERRLGFARWRWRQQPRRVRGSGRRRSQVRVGGRIDDDHDHHDNHYDNHHHHNDHHHADHHNNDHHAFW